MSRKRPKPDDYDDMTINVGNKAPKRPSLLGAYEQAQRADSEVQTSARLSPFQRDKKPPTPPVPGREPFVGPNNKIHFPDTTYDINFDVEVEQQSTDLLFPDTVINRRINTKELLEDSEAQREAETDALFASLRPPKLRPKADTQQEQEPPSHPRQAPDALRALQESLANDDEATLPPPTLAPIVAGTPTPPPPSLPQTPASPTPPTLRALTPAEVVPLPTHGVVIPTLRGNGDERLAAIEQALHNRQVINQYQSRKKKVPLHLTQSGAITRTPPPSEKNNDQFVCPKFIQEQLVSLSVPVGLTQSNDGTLCESHLTLRQAKNGSPSWMKSLVSLQASANKTIQFKQQTPAAPYELEALKPQQRLQLCFLLIPSHSPLRHDPLFVLCETKHIAEKHAKLLRLGAKGLGTKWIFDAKEMNVRPKDSQHTQLAPHEGELQFQLKNNTFLFFSLDPIPNGEEKSGLFVDDRGTLAARSSQGTEKGNVSDIDLEWVKNNPLHTYLICMLFPDALEPFIKQAMATKPEPVTMPSPTTTQAFDAPPVEEDPFLASLATSSSLSITTQRTPSLPKPKQKGQEGDTTPTQHEPEAEEFEIIDIDDAPPAPPDSIAFDDVVEIDDADDELIAFDDVIEIDDVDEAVHLESVGTSVAFDDAIEFIDETHESDDQHLTAIEVPSHPVAIHEDDEIIEIDDVDEIIELDDMDEISEVEEFDELEELVSSPITVHETPTDDHSDDRDAILATLARDAKATPVSPLTHAPPATAPPPMAQPTSASTIDEAEAEVHVFEELGPESYEVLDVVDKMEQLVESRELESDFAGLNDLSKLSSSTAEQEDELEVIQGVELIQPMPPSEEETDTSPPASLLRAFDDAPPPLRPRSPRETIQFHPSSSPQLPAVEYHASPPPLTATTPKGPTASASIPAKQTAPFGLRPPHLGHDSSGSHGALPHAHTTSSHELEAPPSPAPPTLVVPVQEDPQAPLPDPPTMVMPRHSLPDIVHAPEPLTPAPPRRPKTPPRAPAIPSRMPTEAPPPLQPLPPMRDENTIPSISMASMEPYAPVLEQNAPPPPHARLGPDDTFDQRHKRQPTNQTRPRMISSHRPPPEETAMRRIELEPTPLDPDTLGLHIQVSPGLVGHVSQYEELTLSIHASNRSAKFPPLGLTIHFSFSETDRGKIFPRVVLQRSANIRGVSYADNPMEIFANRNENAHKGFNHIQDLPRGHLAKIDLSAQDQARGILLLTIQQTDSIALVGSLRMSWFINE